MKNINARNEEKSDKILENNKTTRRGNVKKAR